LLTARFARWGEFVDEILEKLAERAEMN